MTASDWADLQAIEPLFVASFRKRAHPRESPRGAADFLLVAGPLHMYTGAAITAGQERLRLAHVQTVRRNHKCAPHDALPKVCPRGGLEATAPRRRSVEEACREVQAGVHPERRRQPRIRVVSGAARQILESRGGPLWDRGSWSSAGDMRPVRFGQRLVHLAPVLSRKWTLRSARRSEPVASILDQLRAL